jgi:adenylate cyclase
VKVKARNKQLLELGMIVVVAAVVSITAGHMLSVVRVAENWSRDLRVATLTPEEAQSEQIVIVTISEETLAAFPYRSPLDRRFLSNLLKSLEAKGARLIGVDMLLDQPSEASKDSELKETLHALSVPVVVVSAEASDGLTERQTAFMASYLDGVRTGIPAISVDSVDGTARAIILRRQHEGRSQLGFVAAIANALEIRVPDSDSLRLRYRGVPDANTPPFPTYPAHAVTLLPDAWFGGRIVLIGADLSLTDRHRTPFSVLSDQDTGDMPGVLLLAHGLSQILDGQDDPSSPVWQSSAVIVVFALIGAVIVMFNLSLATKAFALLAAISAIWVGGSVWFQYAGQLAPMVTPTLALALAAALTYALRLREEQVHRRFIHDAFSKFVAPAIVEQLIEQPERLRLGGERRNMTFLFTDIADYTTLTENTEASLLVKVMNEYFDGTCEIIFEHGGTIEKFVGDALHVMFNAPLDQPDHQARAVACALALDAFCQAFAARQRDRMIEFGVTRIGVNTGVTVVGNFGGAKRFDYSATGDAINTAARLESVNKQLGTRVCVSAATIEHCDGLLARPVGELILKGKSESVAAFEPVTNGGNCHCSVDEYMTAYRLLCVEDPEAEDAFRELTEQYPEDALLRFHLTRLAAGERGRVIVMKEK